MANMFDCIQAAIDDGQLEPARGKNAQDEFLQLANRYESAMPRDVAEAQAAKDLKEASRRSATSRRHAVINQLQAMRRNEALVAETVARGGDPSLLPTAVLETVAGSGIQAESVRFVRDSLNRQFHGMLRGLLRKHSKDLLGRVRNQAGLKNIVHELFGEASGDAEAKAIAGAIGKTRDRARSLFNAYGGDIGKLENYGIRHSHDSTKLRKAGFDAWRAEVFDRLDWNRIEDHRTGRPFAEAGGRPAPAAAEEFLRKVFDNITTRGWIDRAPSMAVGGKALYNQRAEARVLHFKSADDWLAYNTAFGDANPFEAIVSQMDGFARDIALMRVLGPNPTLGLEHLIQSVERHAAVRADGKLENAVSSRSGRARTMLRMTTGAANAPADHAWASFLAGTRNLLTGAQLGSAMLSTPTDLATMGAAAREIGMSPKNVFARTAGLLSSHATRDTAAAMGYVADTLANAGTASARYLGDVWSPELTERITDGVLRASGLSYWTDMARTGFQMEFSAHLAQNAHLALDSIDPLLRKTLTDRGITAADWDHLRAPDALFVAPNGAKFLTPLHWVEHTRLPRAEAEGLSLKLGSIMQEEMEFAIPSVSLDARARVMGAAQPGTISGELIRSVAMYKNYAISLTLNQYRRTMAKPGGWSRAKYFTSLAVGMTAMGALSVQLKEMAKGRDPRNMNPFTNPGFIAEAVFQGGGLGIFGDFIRSEESRIGGGLASTLAGPVVGLGSDVLGGVVQNASAAAQGKNTSVARDLTNLGKRYTPGSSLWYGRLALERMFWDQLHEAMDPDAARDYAKKERKRVKSYGNASWWTPTQMTPDRAPNLSNIAGEP